METTFYTFTANELAVTGYGVKAAGGGSRRMVCLHRPASTPAAPGKIIDLAAWRAAHEAPEPQECWEQPWKAPYCEDGDSVPGSRGDHDSARKSRGMLLDWLVSLALIGVSVSACIGFLL